jgi:DNA topoisomerase-1
LKEVGKHPESGKAISIKSGRYGPYVTDGEINASLPQGGDPEALTMEEAVALLAARAAKAPTKGRRGGRGATKTKAAPKKAAKKEAASGTGTKKPRGSKKTAVAE